MKHDHSGEVSHTVEVPEGLKARIAQVKEHLQQNKQTYLIGAGLLVTGYLLRGSRGTTVSNTNTVSPDIHNTINHIVVQALGDPGNVVQCLETGTIYASQGQAARELGISLSNLSKHLNGMQDAVNGLHFEKLGKAGHPFA